MAEYARISPILVTGGAGFIGSNFVHRWLDSGRGRVVVLDKLTYAGNLGNVADVLSDSEVVMVRGDIGDRQAVRDLLHTYRPWAIVNFAAESHVDRSILGPAEFIQTNVVGTFHLLQEAAAYVADLGSDEGARFRFLHVSTDEVFGSLGPDAAAFSETTPYAPNSPYAASKAAADHLVRAYRHTYGLPTLTTNCSNNYGPYQFPEKLIPLVIHNAVDGKPLPVYGDGLNVRDWLYVDDHCHAIMAVLDRGRVGEIYNIGGNCEQTNIAVVRTICQTLDELLPHSSFRPHERLITHVGDRPGHDRRYAIDSSKIRSELGWRPRTAFAAGMRTTIEWYLANRRWTQSVASGDYRDWIERNYTQREA